MADTIEIVQGTATTIEIAGLQGPQGPQGATGATGATGAQGPAGTGIETLTTKGDLLYRDTSVAARLPIGTSGQILKVAASGIPEWGAAPASGVSSVNGETGAVTLDAADVGAAASNHTHGNLTNDGKIGSTSGLPLKTGTAGVVEAGSFGTSAGTFCEGNDARLSDARTPTSHAASHAATGGDAVFDQDLNTTDGVQFESVTVTDLFTLGFEATGTGGNIVRVFGDGLEFVGTSDDTTRTNLGAAASGSITTSGLTQSTARILGRTDASSGPVQEIQIGSGLSLSAGELSATGSGVTAVGASAADILSVSGSDIVADDAGADRLVYWNDVAGKLAYGTPSDAGAASASHTHAASDVTSGTFDNARINFAAPSGIGSTTPSTGAFTSLTGAPAANTAAYAVTGYSLTGSNAQSVIDLAGTWNTTGTPSAIKLNITDTSSNASSLLMQLQTGGTNRFTVNKSGNATFAGNLTVSGNATVSGTFANGGTASGFQSSVIGGRSNSASNDRCIAGGDGCSATATNAISLGNANSSSNTASISLGQTTIASGAQSTSIGLSSRADRLAFFSHAAGEFSTVGDAQRFRAVLRCKTTTNSAVEMALNGSTTYLTIPSGKVIFCNIKVVGVKSDGSAVATYERQYAAKNVAGTSSEVYAAVTIGTDNAASTSLEIATVDAGDYIRIRPTGIASETWRWVASVDAVEVAYGT